MGGIIFRTLSDLRVACKTSRARLGVTGSNAVTLVRVNNEVNNSFVKDGLIRLSAKVSFIGTIVSVSLKRRPSLRLKSRTTTKIEFMFSRGSISVLRGLGGRRPRCVISVSVGPMSKRRIVSDSAECNCYLVDTGSLGSLCPCLPSSVRRW